MFDLIKKAIKSVLIFGAVTIIVVTLAIAGILQIIFWNREGASAPFFREKITLVNRILTTIKEY